MIDLRKCTVSDILHEVALIEEYANECAIYGLPQPTGKLALYLQLEEAGAIGCYGAYFGDALIGFVTVLVSVLPHYGVTVPVSESFFVSKAYRKTGAGLKLLHLAEQHVDELNLPGPLISCPLGSDLAEVLSARKDYAEVGRVFFRNKKHAD